MEESIPESIPENVPVDNLDSGGTEIPDILNVDHDYICSPSENNTTIQEDGTPNVNEEVEDGNGLSQKNLTTDIVVNLPPTVTTKVKPREQHLRHFVLKPKSGKKKSPKSKKKKEIQEKKNMGASVVNVPSSTPLLVNSKPEPVKIVQIVRRTPNKDAPLPSKDSLSSGKSIESSSIVDLQLSISNVFDQKKEIDYNVKKVLLQQKKSRLKVKGKPHLVKTDTPESTSVDSVQEIMDVNHPPNSANNESNSNKRTLEVPVEPFYGDNCEQKKKLKVVKEILAWIPSDPAVVMDIRQGKKKPVMLINGNTPPRPTSPPKVPLQSKATGVFHRKILPAPPQNSASLCSNCNAKLNNNTPRKDQPMQINNSVSSGFSCSANNDTTEAQSEFSPSGITPGLKLVMNEMEALHTNIVQLQWQIDEMKRKEKNYIDGYNNLLKEFDNYKTVAFKMASKSILENLKQIFSENQIDMLMKNKTKPLWTAKEVNSAFKLYRISKSAYNYVRDELHFPLPCRGSILKFALQNKRNFKENLLRAKRIHGVNGNMTNSISLDPESSHLTEDVDVYTSKDSRSSAELLPNSTITTAAD